MNNAWFEELANTSPAVGEDVLDAAIESLRAQEERLASHRHSTRIIEGNAQAAEALRDLRWKLLALRASIEDPGDHPVLDSVEELESYLDRTL